MSYEKIIYIFFLCPWPSQDEELVSGVNSGEESAEDLMKVGYKRNVRPPPSALLQVSYRYCSTTKISTLGHTWPALVAGSEA